LPVRIEQCGIRATVASVILDANIALKWVLPEPDSPKATHLRDEFRKGIHEFLGPDSFPAEIAHA
jgi:hypothetical protein